MKSVANIRKVKDVLTVTHTTPSSHDTTNLLKWKLKSVTRTRQSEGANCDFYGTTDVTVTN